MYFDWFEYLAKFSSYSVSLYSKSGAKPILYFSTFKEDFRRVDAQKKFTFSSKINLFNSRITNMFYISRFRLPRSVDEVKKLRTSLCFFQHHSFHFGNKINKCLICLGERYFKKQNLLVHLQLNSFRFPTLSFSQQYIPTYPLRMYLPQ